MSWTVLVLQQKQNLGRRFCTSKMHLSHLVALSAVCSKAVVLLLLTFCLLLLPMWGSIIVLCFVVRYFMSILVLQSSWWGRDSWLLCLICLPGVSWWLSGSSSRCYGVVCGLWLWYFLIILTYYFWYSYSWTLRLYNWENNMTVQMLFQQQECLKLIRCWPYSEVGIIHVYAE